MAITTRSQLDTTPLRGLVRELLSLPDGAVRPSWDAGPIGGEPFVVVSASDDTPIGTAHREFDGDREVEILRRSLLTEVQFEAFGTNAYLLLSKLQLALESSAALSALKNRVRAAVLRCSQVIDVSAAMGGGPEERARFTATLTHTHAVEIAQLRIDSVDIVVRTDTGAESITIEPPITEQ
ncbi:phage neck terminator protein [Paraburkholderia sp. MM5477-R1]|uniref:phage neck terminator protein n=1 Tax=Paraburkholderia sp. MM5477-R1 TaxID=2991062 RepID=UPI003D1B0530